VFRQLLPVLSSRKPRVKDGVLDCYLAALENVPCDELPLAAFVPAVATLLDDSDRAVRELAFKALGETYRYVGKRIFEWTSKENAGKSNASIWSQLQELFGDIDRANGVVAAPVVPAAAAAPATAVRTTTRAAAVSLDFTSPPAAQRPHFSRGGARREAEAPPPSATPAVSAAPVRRAVTMSGPVVVKAAVNDPDSIEVAAFGCDDQAPKAMPSVAAACARIDALAEPLADVTRVDWNVRVSALQEVRALAAAIDTRDPQAVAQFADALHRHHRSFSAQVLDLRSSVCKEVCATIAQLGIILGAANGAFADELVPSLLKLTYVSKEVMALSGHRAIRALVLTTRMRTRRQLDSAVGGDERQRHAARALPGVHRDARCARLPEPLCCRRQRRPGDGRRRGRRERRVAERARRRASLVCAARPPLARAHVGGMGAV
jgi:hypothetical protein